MSYTSNLNCLVVVLPRLNGLKHRISDSKLTRNAVIFVCNQILQICAFIILWPAFIF